MKLMEELKIGKFSLSLLIDAPIYVSAQASMVLQLNFHVYIFRFENTEQLQYMRNATSYLNLLDLQASNFLILFMVPLKDFI